MRQQVAMVLWTESGERQSVAHNGALLAFSLYRPISGVTLADDQMVSRSTYMMCKSVFHRAVCALWF